MSFLDLRASGILLHPTSLPGPYGIGEIGGASRNWLEQLGRMKQSLWQVLPMGPTGYGDSPYQSFSSFAGNDLLIDLADLAKWGLLTRDELAAFPTFPEGENINYGAVIPARNKLLNKACDRWLDGAGRDALPEESFEKFQAEQAGWLPDYAIFRAIKSDHDERPWTEWPHHLRDRDHGALDMERERHKAVTSRICLRQWIFDVQWQALRNDSRERGIHIIGDIPIFVAQDSADVWCNRSLFQLEENGEPAFVTGVPPDCFAVTGQLWGNPCYDWGAHQDRDFDWWRARVARCLDWYDGIRIDHFRGFEAYYQIPGKAETAEQGDWVEAPGHALFDSMRRHLGTLPIIAEDLGLIDDKVLALRDAFGFPGMQIMQFSYGPPEEGKVATHPLDFPEFSVAYTGTHDNDTIIGWYERPPNTDFGETQEMLDAEHARVLQSLPANEEQALHQRFIAALLATPSRLTLFPIQDLLGQGNKGRMNVPGRPGGNWQWRFRQDDLSEADINFCANVTDLTKRLNR